MVIQYKLTKYSQIMGFKNIIVLLIFIFIFSCKKADDVQNHMYITNSTTDTVYCSMFGSWPFAPNDEYILPKQTILGSAGGQTVFEYIRSLRNEGDSIVFYNKTDTVIWRAPLLNLPDSIHSFYNENSWEITYGGKNNKYEIATFTITEEDFN